MSDEPDQQDPPHAGGGELAVPASSAVFIGRLLPVVPGGGGFGAGDWPGGRCPRSIAEHRLQVAADVGELMQFDARGEGEAAAPMTAASTSSMRKPRPYEMVHWCSLGRASSLSGAGVRMPTDCRASPRKRSATTRAGASPAADHHHVVDGAADLTEDVTGHEDRAACANARAQQFRIPTMPLRVEAVGRLVENDDPRIAEQGGGQAEALAHTHRISADAPVDRVR